MISREIVDQIYGSDDADIETANLMIGDRVFYSDNQKKIRLLKPAILIEVEPLHKYPYKVQGEIGRWKYIASVRVISRAPAVTESVRSKNVRERIKERGYKFRSFRTDAETLKKAKIFCEKKEIHLQDLLLNLENFT